MATSHHNLGELARAQGDLARAERDLRQALAIRTKALPAHHPDLAATKRALDAVLKPTR